MLIYLSNYRRKQDEEKVDSCDFGNLNGWPKNIALMGNLHTTDTMLYGTPDEVYKASLKAMEQAKEGGGFILSTGDQCPYATPDENIFAMLQAVEDSGYYW